MTGVSALISCDCSCTRHDKPQRDDYNGGAEFRRHHVLYGVSRSRMDSSQTMWWRHGWHCA